MCLLHVHTVKLILRVPCAHAARVGKLDCVDAGYMNSLEWSGRMERWNGAVDWSIGVLEYRSGVMNGSLRVRTLRTPRLAPRVSLSW